MVKTMSYYRSALYLTSAVVLTELVFFFYVASFSFATARAPAVRVIIALAILFGLWTQCNVTRYLGAMWFVFSSGSVIWALFSTGRVVWNVGWFWALAVGALSLTTACILLFSKKFANEFSDQRQTQPKFKKILRLLVITVAILATVIAILNDIYHISPLLHQTAS